MNPGEPSASKPGKVRTWWHPLLAASLRWQLSSHYHLQEEVLVGQMPLQIDVLLIRKEQGELPEGARRILAGVAEFLADFTLLEFKSPLDTLRVGDFQTLLAYVLLYRAQNTPLLPPEQLSVVVLAPRLTTPYRQELRLLGALDRELESGVWALEGGPVVHRTWLLETDLLAGSGHPLLTLLSPRFLSEGPQLSAELRRGGYTELVVYLTQQIVQFRQQGETWAMQHLGIEEMNQTLRDVLALLPAEERLAGLAPEERLAGLTPEERLAGLAPEERLAGLTPDDVPADFLASLPAEKRLAGLAPEERLAGLAPEERLAGLAPEELLAGLSEEQRKALLARLQASPPK